MSKLQHPHVVEIVTPYWESQSVGILMRPVADYNLSQYLTTCSATHKERQNILLWFSCLSAGLEHIHGQGVCHGDIKPSNILIKDEKVLFSDFGASTTVAGFKGDEGRPPEFTMLYAAPEILRGERRSESDVFSLGCVFLEMATVLSSTRLWQVLRQHQQERKGLNSSQTHWASTWKKVLYDLTKLGGMQQLLDVFDGMFEATSENRPSATDVRNRITAQTDISCQHYVHQSAQEYVFHVPTRASTWPPDRATLRQKWAESSRRLRLATAKNIQIINNTYLSREAFVVQHEGPEGSMTMSIDVETALTPIYATLRTGGRESKGINLRSMMWYFLHQSDTHDQFRVSGQANASRQTMWVEIFENPNGKYIVSELRKLTLDLSAMSTNDYYERKESTNDEPTTAQTSR